MNQNEFDELIRRQNNSLMELLWPKVKERIMQGQSPSVIAADLSKEGYFGFGGIRVTIKDIQRLWKLSLQEQ